MTWNLRAFNFTFSCGKRNENHHLEAGMFVHKEIKAAVREGRFVSDSMLCIIQRGPWCHIDLNAHALSGDEYGHTGQLL
jgi:hypothetical protein